MTYRQSLPANTAMTSSMTLDDMLAEGPPHVALVLGSGMSQVARRLRRTVSLPFAEVPGMAAPSVIGHPGCLTLGEWAGKRVLVYEGRLHYYEGHPWQRVTLPVQTIAYLRIPCLVLTNAAGGIHEELGPGSFMAIRDHIEWTRPRCWRHPGPGSLVSGRASPYSSRLRHLLAQSAQAISLQLRHGIYAAVTGPNYETPAEIRALKRWGADAVGMSTAREAQAAHDAGLECAALSCITNRAAGLSGQRINPDEVLVTAEAAADRLADVLEGFLGLL